MRYLLHLAYNGSAYAGWQNQPNAVSVQEVIEREISKILQQKTVIVGCGRTDTGVHARNYYAHFDFPKQLPEYFLERINKMLPKDIVIFSVCQVEDQFHARFDARSRAYQYILDRRKNPFLPQMTFHYYYFERLDHQKINEVADLLLQYREFYPFCKTNSDTIHYKCDLIVCNWKFSAEEAHFEVVSNRFLRGMVRLMVGMFLYVGIGRITFEEVKMALDQQTTLKDTWSVPPDGLYLTDVKY